MYMVSIVAHRAPTPVIASLRGVPISCEPGYSLDSLLDTLDAAPSANLLLETQQPLRDIRYVRAVDGGATSVKLNGVQGVAGPNPVIRIVVSLYVIVC